MDATQELKIRFAPSVDGSIAYTEQGSGPAVILLHGGGPGAFGVSNFSRNIEALANAGHRVIVPDLPGYGQSAHRNLSEGLYRAMAAAVFELIEHLQLSKTSLVGNSLGGGTALQVALDFPDRVAKLVLMAPGGSLPVTSVVPSEGLQRMLAFYDGDGPTMEKLQRIIDLLVNDRGCVSQALIEARFRAATSP
jgi:4,5:9,10-diseco-3-hydroxy-5,9,17-trioxoandrosta-1(10),2-diene-4-oate hydrolase